MFVKWPKIKRILIPQINIKGKNYLSDKEVKLLLSGNVSVQEKCDGTSCGIIRTSDGFKLQKRGSLVGTSEHPQFGAFKNWSQINYDKLTKIPDDHILYGEFLWATHTIYYNKLPDWFLAFALYDRISGKYKSRDELVEFCESCGIYYVPEISRGHFEKMELFSLIPKISNFGDEKAEGIVIEKFKDGTRGKIVREEFIKDMEKDEHWTKGPIKKNKLRPKE